MKHVVSTPKISVDIPDGWEAGQTVECWLTVKAPNEVSGFLPNVVVTLVRVSSERPLTELIQGIDEEMARLYTDVVTREIRGREAVLDRSVSFATQGLTLVQYQRMMVVASGSIQVHWFVNVQATCPLEAETDFRDMFSQIMSSIDVEAKAPQDAGIPGSAL